MPVCENEEPSALLMAGALRMLEVTMTLLNIPPLMLIFKVRVAVYYMPSTSYFSVAFRNISSLFLTEE